MKIQKIHEGYYDTSGSPEKKQKKVKKKRFWIKFIVLLVLYGTLIILIAASPLFNIKSIEVEGNIHNDKNDIISTADISAGVNGFKNIGINTSDIISLRYGKAEARILNSFPYIKSVSVKYIIPGKVAIHIVEREPACIVPCVGAGLLMDNEGYVVDVADKKEKYNLPLISGLNSPGYRLGQAYRPDNPENMNAVIKLINAVRDSDKDNDVKLYDSITSIDVSNTRKVLILMDNRITVNFGDLQNLKFRLNFLRQIYIKGLKKDDRGILDFTNGENPNFIPQK